MLMKTLGTVLVLALMFVFATPITAADGTSYPPGDANEDGVVNIFDITYLEMIVAGLEDETPGADANRDGVVNSLDITKTERIVVGLDATPWAGYTVEPNQEVHIFEGYCHAQTFLVSVTHKVTAVRLPIYCQELLGDLTITIRKTVGGVPCGQELCRGVLREADIPSCIYPAPYSEIIFTSGVILERGKRYAIVAEGGGSNVTDSIHWCNRWNSNYQKGEEWVIWNGGYVRCAGRDLLFEEWGFLV